MKRDILIHRNTKQQRECGESATGARSRFSRRLIAPGTFCDLGRVACDERRDEGTLGVGGVASAGASDLADVRAAALDPVEPSARNRRGLSDISSVKGVLVFGLASLTIQLPSGLSSELPSELPSESPADLVRGFYLEGGCYRG